jgi:hypothetical protein
MDTVVTAGHKMSHLMSQQNYDQWNGKRQSMQNQARPRQGQPRGRKKTDISKEIKQSRKGGA